MRSVDMREILTEIQLSADLITGILTDLQIGPVGSPNGENEELSRCFDIAGSIWEVCNAGKTSVPEIRESRATNKP